MNGENGKVIDCGQLRLENQLCFPLYACAKEVVRQYRPFLEELDLTYTQYITMMVMWESDVKNIKELGEELFLDSGTLTPVVRALEKKGFVERRRSDGDNRVLLVQVTEEGRRLKERALAVPEKIGGLISLAPEEALTLYKLLYKVLGNLRPVDDLDKPA